MNRNSILDDAVLTALDYARAGKRSDGQGAHVACLRIERVLADALRAAAALPGNADAEEAADGITITADPA